MAWVRTVAFASSFALALCCEGRAPQATSPASATSGSATAVAGVPLVVPESRDDGRLPTTVKPVAYRLELDVSPEAGHFSGRVHIDVRVEQPTRAIVLSGRKLRIRSVTVSAGGVAQPAEFRFRKAHDSKGEADELVLTTKSAIPAGDAALDFTYEADFSEGLNGLYHVKEDGRFYAFTQFEPVGARLAFPCFDEPEAKAPFEIVVTVPAGQVALSNMPVARRTETPEGGTIVEFEKSPPLPTYLVALAVGPLELREGQGASVPLRIATVAGRSKLGELALKTAGEQLTLLEAYFGTRYPYPKLDLVAVPDFSSGAMENAGLVTFREERLLVDPTTAPTALRRALSGTIAHELSHMWFGDLVTMRWWDDIWLNEGFATWMATRTLDAWHPEMRAGIEELGSTDYALRVDTLESARRVRQPVRSTTEALEAFDGITYSKGAALLGMVERWVGPDVFQRGVADYLAAHRLGSATSEDLFDAIARASGKDVAGVLRTFTEQTGVPSVRVAPCRLEAGRPALQIITGEYRPLGAATSVQAKTWRLPICVHYGGREGAGRACALAAGASTRLDLPTNVCPSFVHPNAEQSGYYRSLASGDELTSLAALPGGSLTARERVGLLSDAWAGVEAGELEVSSYFELASRYRRDPEPAAWGLISSALETLDDDVVSEQDRPAFGAAVRDLLAPEAALLGWNAHPGDGDPARMKRRLVLTALGAIGRDPATLRGARAIADRWLTAPTSVDGDRAAVALPLAARSGDAALFDRFVKILGGSPSPPAPADRVLALTALGEFQATPLVDRALGLVLDGTVRSQDQGYLMRGLFRRPETRATAFAFVEAHLEAFLSRIPPFARRRIVPLIATACSPEEIERKRAILSPTLATMEGADRGFAQALEEGARCAARKARHSPKIGAWLSKSPLRKPNTKTSAHDKP